MEGNSKELHITYSAIPTYENVSYAFERLITPITIATSFELEIHGNNLILF